ncbi:hypothetical protein NDU88_002319 [Pleurodeles waltl]|uniref:TTF-type domain-containing protein n=1 Tax=Pleurodeles waltl TaxID=8319 RepID=A0AAV7QCJ5_PLEWA|nr:hypothetical protein NDU88_002319 [Pleurodeles waltl]
MDIRKFFVKKQPSEVTLFSDNSETNTIHCNDMPDLQSAIQYGVRVADFEISSDYAPVPGTFCEAVTSSDESSNSSSATATSLQDNEETLGSTVTPNQPSESTMPVQIIETQSQTKKKRILHFQGRWFQDFPWLHYSDRVAGVLCFHCAKAKLLKLTELSKNAEEAFCSTGYTNWKKAIERFKKHQSSYAHSYALNQLAHYRGCQPINQQLSQQIQQQQNEAWLCLNKIIHTIAFLAKQGLALRGHDDSNGNFRQFLSARAEDVPSLKQWITANRAEYLSPDIQNEVLQLLSHEHFIGLYQADNTTGTAIATIVKDVLCRHGLSLSNLRAQTYDGAANMAGKYHGAQALIRQEQPLALYVHCGAHCTNLVMQAAAHKCSIMEDALLYVQELGNLFGQSLTCRTIFSDLIQHSIEGPTNVLKIKPLCPTRWTVRVKAVQKVMDNYEPILETLEQLSTSKSSGDVSARARGLLAHFQRGTTVLGLQIALQILQLLECLNIAMQGRQQTISGLLAAVNVAKSAILKLRNDESFNSLIHSTNQMTSKYHLNAIEVPRLRRIPKRIDDGAAETFHPATVGDYYRPQYFELLDTVSVHLTQRFDQEGIQRYEKLEQVLLTGSGMDSISQYKEIDPLLLKAQLTILSSMFKYSSVPELADILRKMLPRERAFFSQVEKLLQILLIIPVSSCEAERSFSGLRRLKTWLRSTMSQKRLNHVAICNIHKEMMDSIDLQTIAKQFVLRSERRKKLFGFSNSSS